jgi:hypothetical protein
MQMCRYEQQLNYNYCKTPLNMRQRRKQLF